MNNKSDPFLENVRCENSKYENLIYINFNFHNYFVLQRKMLCLIQNLALIFYGIVKRTYIISYNEKIICII